MELVQNNLGSLSQSVAGLLLASLVVFVVLLIGFILFRKSGKDQQTSLAEPVEDTGPTAEVVDLKPVSEAPSERAIRFDALATQAIQQGRLGEAKELFQKALVVADDDNNKDLSARARFELGNLAKAHSDLLSACENWQLARELYEKIGDKKKVRELDAIMTDAQCPSDWVLNKF